MRLYLAMIMAGCLVAAGCSTISSSLDNVVETATGDDTTGSPSQSGTGLVFGVAEVFSNNSLGVADVTLVDEGETPRFKLLDNGGRFLPSRHTSGQVVVTEACFREGDSLVEYRRLVVLTSDGGTAPVTPCSHSIDSPGGFTWI